MKLLVKSTGGNVSYAARKAVWIYGDSRLATGSNAYELPTKQRALASKISFVGLNVPFRYGWNSWR